MSLDLERAIFKVERSEDPPGVRIYYEAEDGSTREALVSDHCANLTGLWPGPKKRPLKSIDNRKKLILELTRLYDEHRLAPVEIRLKILKEIRELTSA